MFSHEKTHCKSKELLYLKSFLLFLCVRSHSDHKRLIIHMQPLSRRRLLASSNTRRETLSLSVKAQELLMLRSAGCYDKHIYQM